MNGIQKVEPRLIRHPVQNPEMFLLDRNRVNSRQVFSFNSQFTQISDTEEIPNICGRLDQKF